MLEKLQNFMSSIGTVFGRLGARRLVALGLTGVMLFAAILFSSFYLTRSNYETLYIGLSRDDVNRMGMALGESGISFDISADGASVRVPVGMAEKARMFLAEKGLPTSNNAGYELFDKMGSLGLTSFMQEITRQRALEGEIARTIQAVQGVKAARIHIVLPDKGSFRRANQKPTASVVIRTDGGFLPESAQAIRHLVSAAVPSLETGAVTILDTNGQLLASGDDTANASPAMMVSLEHQVASQINENIRKQLMPYLGADHFQTSVQVELDTDRRQINETTYDPGSQVARSVRNMREQADSQNSRNNDAVSVEQNIPQEEISSGNGENASDKRNRREEITNYEINSKIVSTMSDGYQVKKLAIAVVIDRSRLSPGGNQTPAPAQYVDDQITRIRQMVAAAAGLDTARGDIINVAAVDFIAMKDADIEPVHAAMWETVSRYTPVLINSTAMVIAVLLILLLGVRPLVRGSALALEDNANSSGIAVPEGDAASLPQSALARIGHGSADASDNILGDLRQRMRMPPQARLEQMMELDEERFAGILHDWIREEKPANPSGNVNGQP